MLLCLRHPDNKLSGPPVRLSGPPRPSRPEPAKKNERSGGPLPVDARAYPPGKARQILRHVLGGDDARPEFDSQIVPSAASCLDGPLEHDRAALQ